MSSVVSGGLLGLVLGTGLVLVAAFLRARRVTLDQRLAPYLRPRRPVSALVTDAAVRGPVPTLARLLAPVMADGVRLVSRLSSTTPVLRRRLLRAGRLESVEQFRAGQVVGGVAGLTVGLGVALVLAAARGVALVPLVVLVAVSTVVGVLARDWLLSRQVRTREARMLAELPTVAELLALAVGAGEGAVGALERVVRTTRGELTSELAATLADARSGTPIVQALDGLADRTGLSALTRFAEGVSVALERGTPLAAVLRAQAQDVRDESRRVLMEIGGRKEVAMLVPVAFFILPITVLFAVFPVLAAVQKWL